MSARFQDKLARHLQRRRAMIVICSYCKRQRVAGQWLDALPPPFGMLVSHGICETCYKREMLAAGFTETEIASDLERLNGNAD